MVLRMRAMNQAAVVATTMLALVGLGPWPLAQAVAQTAGATDAALSKPVRARPPARIRVHPLVQSYPGPDAVRQCTAWLAPEYRLSGTVIVPKMRCWWERG
jgi:hypothetical protein